jgi:hypothetical protein
MTWARLWGYPLWRTVAGHHRGSHAVDTTVGPTMAVQPLPVQPHGGSNEVGRGAAAWMRPQWLVRVWLPPCAFTVRGGSHAVLSMPFRVAGHHWGSHVPPLGFSHGPLAWFSVAAATPTYLRRPPMQAANISTAADMHARGRFATHRNLRSIGVYIHRRHRTDAAAKQPQCGGLFI